jgi:D-xylose transport system substrate-binding protein
LQATSLKDKLGDKGTIVMINGAPTDNNAKLFKAGAHSVFDDSNIKIGKEYDTPDWSPDKAQSEMQQAITALGKDGFQGVYAANDGTAGGAIAAMKSSGVNAEDRPTTGQDAELAAIQRILAGTQYMTIYKAIKPEAEQSAQLAVALANGDTPDASLITGKTEAGGKQIDSIIFDPVVVTKDNINDTIIKDGYWTAAQICTSAYAADCKAAGIE